MSVEENLEKIAAFERVFNERDWEAFNARHAEDVVAYSSMSPEPERGLKAHREALQALVKAFPDARLKLGHSFGQDDWVFVSYAFTGTHRGPLRTAGGQEIPPTNREVTLTTGHTVRFEGGKIAEEHAFIDRMALMEQLGLVP